MKIQLQTTAFVALVDNMYLLASTDKMTPVLAGARLELDGSSVDVTLTASVTNRFAAARRRVTVEPGFDQSGAVTLDARALHDVSKRLTKANGDVVIAWEDGDKHASVTHPLGADMVAIVDGDYPNVARLFESFFPNADKLDKPVTLGVNPKWVAAFGKMTDRNLPVVMIPTKQDGAWLVKAGDLTVGLVMPTRTTVTLDDLRAML